VITAEQLHDAANILATLEGYPEDAQVEAFINNSDFPNYKRMDSTSLAYGICIGIIVMTLHGQEQQ